MNSKNLINQLVANFKLNYGIGLLERLKCYPRQCLCSHNINNIDENTRSIWIQYLKSNDNWCPYNYDGTKKLPNNNENLNFK